MIAPHGEDSLLSEHHRLVVYRSVFEAEYHAAFDLCPALNLEEITRRQESAVNIAKLKEAVGNTFGVAYCDRRRRGRVQSQQQYQQAERRDEQPDGGD